MLAFKYFRCHLIGSAHISLSPDALLAETPAEPKVAELDVLLPVDEQIARLDVPVENLLGMYVVESHAELIGDFPNHLLGHLLTRAFALLDQVTDIPMLTLLHDNLNYLFIFIN